MHCAITPILFCFRDMAYDRQCLAQADNPGVWMMHCHVDWHMFMGQKMYFSVEPETAPQPPSDLPQCPSDCLYNFGPFTPDYVEDKWGDSGYAA